MVKNPISSIFSLSGLPIEMADRKVEKKVISDQPQISSSIAGFDPPKKPAKKNKYAIACSVLASMTSVLLGYGKLTTTFTSYDIYNIPFN